MFTQDDWLNRVNAPYLDAARKREAGFLPSNFADQFEEIPERGFWDAFASGAKAQGAGVLQGQAEFANALGIGNGDFANAMNQVMQENARRREFTWQDMVNDPMKYISDPEGLMYDLGGAFGSTGVLLGETALTGGVGGVATRAMGLAGKIGGTARMIAAIDKVAKANNMPWVHNILVSPAGKMLALNIMKTPFEAVSEGGNVRREIRETGGTEEEQLSGMLSSTALNAVLLTFTNSLESAGLGKLIAKEGGKDALVKKLTGVTQTAAKEAAKPNFVQKMNLLNKVDFATVGKTAVGLTANALQNAYEEGAQETIGQYAKGEKDNIVDIVNPFAWSDEALTGAAIGGVTGAAQGAVMTGVGKGLNKALGFEEKKPQELKVTTPAKQEKVSGEEPQNLELQEQLQAQVQEPVHPQVQAQVQGYEEAFGVDEESVKAFEEKQRQQLSQAVANGVDEEVLQAEEDRKNQLLDILGIDIPQFTGAKKQEQPKVAPQSPIKPKAWNQTQKGGYIGRYSDESIKKALNKSDAQLKEFALKIQKLNDKDQMKIAVYNELKKRGIDMGKGFMMEEPEAQLEVYKPKFSDIPAEKLQNAAQWYADKPQQFEKDYQNAISRLQRLAINNDAAKELLQNLQQFRETVMSYQKIQQENKPLLALQQGIPEEVLQAVEANPEEAALIFEEEAEKFVAENINTIEDVNERKKQARYYKDSVHESLRDLLSGALKVLNAGRNKGYSLVPGNQDNGRKVRMSNNDLWYQEFRKEKQHKPLVEEMEELAYLLAIDKFPYSMPYEFAEILNDPEYQKELPELKQQLDYLRANYFALKEAYEKTLEESKQSAKEKGEKNEKGKSEPKRTETSKSKNDGNTAPQSSEEKKTDGEVKESSAIGSLIKKERQRLQTGNYPTITKNKNGNKITYSTNEYGTKTEKVGRGKGIPKYQSALSVENANLNKNTPTPSKQALKRINADDKKVRATKSDLHNKLTDIIYHDKYANLAEKQQARTLLDFMLSVYSREQQESLTYEELQKAYEKYEYNIYIFGGKHFKQGTKEESDVVARNRKNVGEQQIEETKAQIKLEVDELIPELLEDYNNVDFNEVLAEINRSYGYPNSFNSLFTYDELANVIKDHLAKRNSNLSNAFEKYYEKLKANDEIWQLNFIRKSPTQQAKSAPQQEKNAESKEIPIEEEKVAENGDFPAKIGDYELVPLKKGNPSNMRDYQNPSSPSSDFYNVLVDSQTGVVYVTGSGMTEGEELGFPAMQDAVNFIRDGEAYKGLSAKEVKSKQAMVKRMESGVVTKPTEKETPKVPKATQAVIDYVKEQTNLDLTPYLDNTFKAKRGQMNIRITSIPKAQLNALKMFVYKTSQGYGSYQIEIEDLGNWGITLKFKKQDGSNPVKYSATELDKKFQIAYHGSPHIFNEFSLEHIGTGEGAQVHGWGLYFTQSERVAKGYRERLSHIDPDEAPKNVIIDGIKYRNIDGTWENATTGEYYDIDSYQDIAFNAVANEEGDVKSALKNLKKDTYYNKDVLAKAIELLEQADSVDYQVEISEGSVFEVDIPENDVLLDEEKTFAEQPQKVREALQTIVDKIKANPDQVASTYYIDDLLTNSKLRGRDIYYRLSRTLGGNDRLTSLVLNDHGIKGITYVSGQDGHCYVVFDDKAIAIKRRYDTAMVEHQNEIKEAAEKQKALLKDALKGGKFELQDNGDYKITMPNGVVILASVKDQILINSLEMQGAKAAHGLKGEAISILGSFQKITSGGINALINLSASTAKNTTAYHEATHALIELALTEKQKQLIFDTLKPMAEKAGKDLEEFVCDYVADWRLKRNNANLFGKLWQKVFDMAKRLQAWFTQTENMHNLLRKIETGEVWKQTAETEAKQAIPVNSKYFATDLAERFQEFLHGEEDVFESEQYKKHNELRQEAQEQSDALWKEYKALDEKIESLMPSLDSDKAKELAKEYQLDLDFYSDRQMLSMMLKQDVEFELKEVRKQKSENFNKRKKLDYEVRKNRILAERIVQKASRQLRKKHFFTEPPKPTNKSEFEGFTIEKTGIPYYDDILETLDVDKGGYRIKRSSKHGVAYIAEISPLEYMDRCALEIFNRTYHSNLYGALCPVGDVDKYADMMKNGTKFNLPMLNYNSARQEGRHRALAAYLNGIDKIPVLVVGTPEYNVTPKKFSAEEAKPQTPTAIVATATKDSQPKGFWETVSEKGFFKTLWDKFYTDWVDKFRPLQAIDSITEQNLGRPLEKLESVRGQATAMNYRAAGVAQALLDGDEKAIEILQSMLRKKGITLHKATLQMVLDKIKPSEMNSKYGKNWLKENGLKTWHQGLSNYLFANRVKEMYDIRWQEYLEALEERAKAIEDLTDEQKEKLAEYDAKVDEWNANGREPDKRPRRPKDIVIPYKQKSTGEEVNIAKKPLWEDSEWGYNLPQNLSIGQINAMIKTSPKEFEEAAEIYYKLNDNLLMVLQDADIINGDVRKAMNTKYQKYCPLMRDFTDTADAESFLGGLTSGGKSIGNVSVPIHKIKAGGSERAVTSPLESTINAIAVFTQRAERNKVAQLAVEMTRKSGATNLVMEAPKGTTPSAKDSTFTVMYDGKKKVFACKPELYGAIAGYNIPTASMVFKVASKAANYLRLGATTSPSFILRNFIRDTIFAGISSKNGFIPIYDSLRGMYLLQKNPEMRAKFHAAGVDQFNFFSTGEARYKKLEVMSKEDNRSLFNPMKWIEAFRDYSELVEASTRMGEFARALERGKSIFEAAEDARNVTLNFTRMGARGEQVNKVIPFFNACIQGGDKMIDMFRKDFVGTCINTLMYIVVPSIVLWGLNHNEDWYKKLNPEIKNNYWCFGKSIKIPKPQEIGVLFGSGTESVLDEAFNKDKKAVDNWWKAFSNNVIPSFMPTIFLPMYEWQANYSLFSGKEVVSKKLQRLPDELQYNQGTSEISKFVGSTAKISPIKLDNAIRSITGTMGMFLYQTAGMPFEDKKHEPTKYWYERQFFRDFTVTDMNLNRNVNDFYEIHSKSEKQHAGYGKKGSPSIATKNIRNAYKAISDINKDIQKIQTSTNISPDRKRLMLDNKRKHIDKIAEKIVRKYGEHYL